jgi:hypothetical protein
MSKQKIRIRLKAFDYKLIDQSALEQGLNGPNLVAPQARKDTSKVPAGFAAREDGVGLMPAPRE